MEKWKERERELYKVCHYELMIKKGQDKKEEKKNKKRRTPRLGNTDKKKIISNSKRDKKKDIGDTKGKKRCSPMLQMGKRN